MSPDERAWLVRRITAILLDGYDVTPALRQHMTIKAGLIVDRIIAPKRARTVEVRKAS